MDLLKSVVYAAQDFLQLTEDSSRSDNKTKPSKGKMGKGDLGRPEPDTHRVIFVSEKSEDVVRRILKTELSQEQLAKLKNKAIQSFATPAMTVWVLNPHHLDSALDSSQGRSRDLCGHWLRAHSVSGEVQFHFAKAQQEEVLGAFVGLGLASYNFLSAVKNEKASRTWVWSKAGGPIARDISEEAVAIFSGMNMARHLTNMPAGTAYPRAIADCALKILKGRKGVRVEVWDEKRLLKEKMGLLLGVGAGAVNGPCLVHIRYRSTQKTKNKPVALVGKGVTFDTGGLDIKASSNMRLMKKDMAGAATVLGLSHYVSSLQLDRNFDFYLSLAENAVSGSATRPGDVHRSRRGDLVEIDNTDAEGRLVMADAFDVAITQKGADAPAALINVATLTGAMRVALGLDVAGYFSNNDKLAAMTQKCADKVGEPSWRMPLVQKYKGQLASPFADFKNSSSSGYGGAITAALFLEKFVGQKPWLHFDVMSWNLSGDGPYAEGGNAQTFQILASLCSQKVFSL